jgi:predicted RNA-binding protein Jag
VSSAEAVVPAPIPPPSADKRAQAEQWLGEVFRLAGWPARLELKDAADGGIAVAVHLDGEIPGVAAGKKSYLVEALQFLVNKVVNRPNTERRWVSLGIGGFPEPRPLAAPSAPPASRPAPRAVEAPPKTVAVAEEPVEEIAVSAEWKTLAKLLAGKAVKHGRVYAVMSLPSAERAQLVKAAQAESGIKVKVEGEGHFRRVAFVPEKATPMPRKMQFPADEDEDDGED